MPHLIPSFTRAIRSLFVPGMFGVFVFSVLLTLGVLLGFIAFSTSAVAVVSGLMSPDGDTNGLALGLTMGLAFIIAWFLFPGIMPIIVNFFDNRIASLIEKQDYPAAPPAKEPPFWPELWHDARFSLLAIGLNLLALPLYFVPVINVVLFYLLNGYLLGREFFVMAARRHVLLDEANALRKSHARTVTLAGMALAFLATLPVANLFAPFWGIAAMVHLYHRLAGTPQIV